MAKRKRSNKAKNMPANISNAAPVVENAQEQTQTTDGGSDKRGTPSRRTQLREAAAAKRRRQNLLTYGAVGVILVVIAVIVVANVRGNAPVVGEDVFTTQGNLHIPMGSTSPVEYNSVPPTSGPHYETVAAWGTHNEPVRYEHLLHNLEDGGVVVYYQCPDGCEETVTELRTILDPMYDQGMHVVLAPNDPTWQINGSGALHEDIGAQIAVTAWQRRLLLDEVDEEAIRAFVDRYEGIDNH